MSSNIQTGCSFMELFIIWGRTRPLLTRRTITKKTVMTRVEHIPWDKRANSITTILVTTVLKQGTTPTRFTSTFNVIVQGICKTSKFIEVMTFIRTVLTKVLQKHPQKTALTCLLQHPTCVK